MRSGRTPTRSPGASWTDGDSRAAGHASCQLLSCWLLSCWLLVAGCEVERMTKPTGAFRDHLVRILDWEEAHVGFDKAVEGIPPDKRGARAAGFEHSTWQLVEHLRLAQEDILDFCVNSAYKHTMAWPDDYWPKDPAPPNGKAWTDGIASYTRAREEVKRLAREVEDLTT